MNARIVSRLSLMALAGVGTVLSTRGEVRQTSAEIRQERNWFTSHLLEPGFEAGSFSPPLETNAPVVAGLEVIANNDAVFQNGRGEHPMRIGTREFRRGLYCHALSKVEVHLPGPGRRFTAMIGLDHNDDTAHGKGSVVFTVKVNGQTTFASGVMRYGTPAVGVDVDLHGADAFTLEIGDAGDGIGWDQSDWADAKATLMNGQEEWLGDMPLRDYRGGPPMVAVPRASTLPFSFIYNGQLSDRLLALWPKTTQRKKLDAFRLQQTFTWNAPETGLEVKCVCVQYSDFAAGEWTLFFRNHGRSDSAVLENIRALDARFDRKGAGEFVLRGCKGDWCVPQSYEPYQISLGPGTSNFFTPDGGRPTNGPRGWPYFNLETPDGGLMFAIGWPGQWACTFTRDQGQSLHILAGQQTTHLVLKPGEEIRTPLIATVFWKGTNVERAQNVWRRWMLAHNVPRLNGKLPPTLLQMQCYRTFEKGGEQDLFDTVKEFQRADIPFDLCWRDAGWYPCKGSWPNTGTWEIDPQRYPSGFRPFADWLHEQGKKFIVWFEPERVGDRQSWLARNHPDWILGGNLLDLGNAQARHWLIEHIDRVLREQGIDYYRQDFNMDPLSNWPATMPRTDRG